MKIFSSYDEYGYEDEKLYSVLMSEEEMYLFSEIQKEFASIKDLKKSMDLVGRQAGKYIKSNPNATTWEVKKAMSGTNAFRNVKNNFNKIENRFANNPASMPSALKRHRGSISGKMNAVDGVLAQAKPAPSPLRNRIQQRRQEIKSKIKSISELESSAPKKRLPWNHPSSISEYIKGKGTAL